MPAASAIAKAAERIAKNYRWQAHVTEVGDIDPSVINDTVSLLVTHVPNYWPTPQEMSSYIKDQGDFSTAVAIAVVDKIAASEAGAMMLREQDGNDTARALALDALGVALETALQDKNQFKELMPHILIETLSVQGDLKRRLEEACEFSKTSADLVRELQHDMRDRTEEIITHSESDS